MVRLSPLFAVLAVSAVATFAPTQVAAQSSSASGSEGLDAFLSGIKSVWSMASSMLEQTLASSPTLTAQLKTFETRFEDIISRSNVTEKEVETLFNDFLSTLRNDSNWSAVESELGPLITLLSNNDGSDDEGVSSDGASPSTSPSGSTVTTTPAPTPSPTSAASKIPSFLAPVALAFAAAAYVAM
ncbi:hypothetical protein FI667_g9355, partial [Globisporangium splendens]